MAEKLTKTEQKLAVFEKELINAQKEALMLSRMWGRTQLAESRMAYAIQIGITVGKLQQKVDKIQANRKKRVEAKQSKRQQKSAGKLHEWLTK